MTRYLYRSGSGINSYFLLPENTLSVIWVKLGNIKQKVITGRFPQLEPADIYYCPYGAFLRFRIAPPPGHRNVKIKLEVEG